MSIEEQALVELTHWVKRVAQYSAAHPACAELGQRTLAALTRTLALASPLTIGVLKDEILIGETHATHPVLRTRLAPHLHERGVLVVRFIGGLTARELSDFVELLTLPAATIFDDGGLLRLTMDRAIARIQVEELAHDVTDEEREAQKTRQKMREFFREMLRNLLAQRGVGESIGEHLRKLLDHPDIAVTILEEDSAGLAEAGAGLALMVQQEEQRMGEELATKLRDVFLTLAPESRSRLFLGLPSLVGDFRQALAWSLSYFSERELAKLAFPAFRARADDIDVALYALVAAVPRDLRRQAALRWIARGLFDLPADESGASDVLATLARPVPEYDSFREERECLRSHAARAVATRDLLKPRVPTSLRSLAPNARGGSIAPSMPPPSTPLGAARGSIPSPRISAMSMPRVSSSIPPSMGSASSSRPPASLRGGAASFDARRASSAVLRATARTGQLARVCRSLPAAAQALANEGAGDAVLGIIRGLSESAKEDPNGPAAQALRQIGSSETAAKILGDLEEAVVTLDGDELDDILSAVKILVSHSSEIALDRLDASENRKMRRLLLDALGHAGAATLPLARARLGSSKWFVVRNAVLLVARCGGTAQDLAGAAHHTNEKVRLEVIRALRSVPQDEASMNIITQYLTDTSTEVRSASLVMLKGESLGPAAITTLEALASDDGQPEDLRRRIVGALGHSKHDVAANVLFNLMHPKGLLERGAAGAVREAAAVALHASPAPGAKSLFEQGLQSNSGRVRKACERAKGGAT